MFRGIPRNVLNFFRDSWRLMRGPRTAAEHEAARIQELKQQKLLPSWVLFPAEQEVEHEQAQRHARRFRDRFKKNTQA